MTGFTAAFSSAFTLHSARTPGRGSWNGHEVQLLRQSSVPVATTPTPEMVFEAGRDYVVITRRLHEMRKLLAARHPDRICDLSSPLRVSSVAGEILVGTPDAWLSQHHLLQEKLATAVLVMDSCSPSELRGLRVRPGLFPYVEQGKVAVMSPTGHVHRAQIHS